MSRHRLPLLSLLACALLGCVESKYESLAPLDAPLDADHYASHVQPYVALACASLDCHGDGGRPLRLYSELGLRLHHGLRPRAQGDTVEAEPLVAEELRRNVAAFRSLEPAHHAGDERLVLSKPLSRKAGGAAHVGGDLFATSDAPGHRCLQGWLSAESAGPDACAEALEGLGALAPGAASDAGP
ncbi:MAG: hypothetical protein OEZ06_13640 [Myxococcales bacterium]|nr:hypothetical protein [Myxococcales bacterium]